MEKKGGPVPKQLNHCEGTGYEVDKQPWAIRSPFIQKEEKR